MTLSKATGPCGPSTAPARRAWTTLCKAVALESRVTVGLGGWVLSPFPIRSIATVAYPASAAAASHE